MRGLFACIYHLRKGETAIKRYEEESLRNFIRKKGRAVGTADENSHSNRSFVATELFRRDADLRMI